MDRKRSDIAEEAFIRKYNCAQSVILAFPELINGSDQSVLKQSYGFGGGMGRLQETCGALTGGFMVIGLFHGTDVPDEAIKDNINKNIQKLTSDFKSKWGTTNCRDLLGLDLNTTEGQELHKSLMQRENICLKCVISVVDNLGNIMQSPHK
jgi:C_GCAxxG_C_C family probable redox protein